MREASVKSCEHVCRCVSGNCREERDVVSEVAREEQQTNVAVLTVEPST